MAISIIIPGRGSPQGVWPLLPARLRLGRGVRCPVVAGPSRVGMVMLVGTPKYDDNNDGAASGAARRAPPRPVALLLSSYLAVVIGVIQPSGKFRCERGPAGAAARATP